MTPFHRPLRTGLAACALMLAVGGTARAQYVYDDAMMPPRAVAWRLGERGFTGIARPRFDGRAYVVEAFDPGGVRVRLFVDAQDGAILGRQRLEAAPMSIARPVPGYGWTEEDAMPRRPMRQAERLLSPADIPMPEGRGVPLRRPLSPDAEYARPDASIGSSGRALADPNPQGINPDRQGHSEPARKVARIGNPAKALDGKAPDGKAQPRAVPEAPRLRPVEAAKPEMKSETPVAAVDQPRSAPLPAATPAAVQPPSEGTVTKPADQKASESKAADVKSAETKAAETKTADPAWKNPPETKRNVRVIGGATLVPGTPDKETPAP